MTAVFTQVLFFGSGETIGFTLVHRRFIREHFSDLRRTNNMVVHGWGKQHEAGQHVFVSITRDNSRSE